jgi:hypothetical protein
MNKKGFCRSFGVKDVSVCLTNIKNAAIIKSLGTLGTYDLLSGIEEN